MLLVKSTTPKKINGLHLKPTALSVFFVAFFLLFFGSSVMAQDNSPYTRYGVGDLVPSTNVNSRGMGGISAGYNEILAINFSNPASYAFFQTFKEPKSKKLINGRAILDIGVNLENRTLRDQNFPTKFAAGNALFSHVQIGVPLSTRAGLSFGLRPISRISYKIGKSERLFDPLTNLPIDSAYTEYTGDGGSYLASVGVGYKLVNTPKHILSVGLNGGYMFGKKDYSTRRSFINDSIEYYRGNFETRTTFGNLYLNAGLQYRMIINEKERKSLTFGLTGAWSQSLKAHQDITRETYYVDANNGNVTLDSVSSRKDIRGTLEYPSSFTAGFVYEREQDGKHAGWLFGLDYSSQKWSQYRFYGQPDLVADKWEVRVGGQLRPIPTQNYFSRVAYRAGFFTGPDYIRIDNKIPQFGASIGFGLPVANLRTSFASLYQATIVNLSFEYIKRGNSDNVLRENLFRFSLGFSLSDLWFQKRKYD
jgi:hypothetical protein